jgi:glucose/mannose-6-phosphate isomerase
MEDAIRNSASQFSFKPKIENENKLPETNSFVLCGMGGSHLAAGLLKIFNPAIDLYIHRDYGLPALAEKRFKSSLFIASSYSGNTEEVVDFAEKALDQGYAVAVIATGGALVDFAVKNSLPHVVLPQGGIQPRNAVGLSLMALVALVGDSEMSAEFERLGTRLNPDSFEEAGEKLAKDLQGKIPVVYSSRSNLSVGYNWKIKFNETAKIPAFANVFPELNHNEMTGFDVIDSTRGLSEKFHFIFLSDSGDSPKIMQRMEVLSGLLQDRGFAVTQVEIKGGSVFEKVFNSLFLADWTALNLSKIYKTEPEKVPMVEEFKKLI